MSFKSVVLSCFPSLDFIRVLSVCCCCCWDNYLVGFYFVFRNWLIFIILVFCMHFCLKFYVSQISLFFFFGNDLDTWFVLAFLSPCDVFLGHLFDTFGIFYFGILLLSFLGCFWCIVSLDMLLLFKNFLISMFIYSMTHYTHCSFSIHFFLEIFLLLTLTSLYCWPKNNFCVLIYWDLFNDLEYGLSQRLSHVVIKGMCRRLECAVAIS